MIAVCSLVFFAQLGERGDDGGLVERFGMIPSRVLDPDKPIWVVQQRLIPTPAGLHVAEVRRPMAPPALPVWP